MAREEGAVSKTIKPIVPKPRGPIKRQPNQGAAKYGAAPDIPRAALPPSVPQPVRERTETVAGPTILERISASVSEAAQQETRLPTSGQEVLGRLYEGLTGQTAFQQYPNLQIGFGPGAGLDLSKFIQFAPSIAASQTLSLSQRLAGGFQPGRVDYGPLVAGAEGPTSLPPYATVAHSRGNLMDQFLKLLEKPK